MKVWNPASVVGALTLVSVVICAPAQADEWPPADAVDVVALQVARLQPDGTAWVSARVKCAPEWEAADLSARLDRSFTDNAEGFASPDVACDNRWHRVTVKVSPVSGSLDPGRASIGVQFGVTHVVFGDFAGAHDTTTGRLVRAGRG